MMGGKPEQVAPYGTPRQILHVRTRQDGRTLSKPPGGTWGLTMDVWIAEPPRP
jgi:hypothetical protein